MSRAPRRWTSKAPTKAKHNWTNKLTRESRRRDKLLDKGRENYFKYDLEDILVRAEVPQERQLAFVGSVFAKGSRLGIEDAKEFVKEKQAEGMFPEAVATKILQLIENYATWR
jgi:hypothetical protein